MSKNLAHILLLISWGDKGSDRLNCTTLLLSGELCEVFLMLFMRVDTG